MDLDKRTIDAQVVIAIIEQRVRDLDEMTTIVSTGTKRDKYMNKAEELRCILRLVENQLNGSKEECKKEAKNGK